MTIAIALEPVQSSRIAAIGYDADAEVLAVQFPPSKSRPNGSIYHYEGVPWDVYEELLVAESIGKFFGREIKDNPSYAYRRVDNDDAYQEAVRDEAPSPDSEAVLLPEDEDGLKNRAIEVSNQIRALAVDTPAHYEIAAAELLRVVAEKKLAQARIDEIKKPVYAAYQAALRLEKDVITPYTMAEQWLKGGMSTYRVQEERQRREEERRLQAEANQKAREEAERKAKESAERRADIARAEGEPEKAEAILQQPLPIAPLRPEPVVLARAVPRVAGISERKHWTFRVVDEMQIPREYLSVDMAKIRGVVKALKNQTNIPGVQVFEEVVTGARA